MESSAISAMIGEMRYRDAPILDIVRSKRSNNVPSGAIVVPSYASTTEVDLYGTRITQAAMDAAWPEYMNVAVMSNGVLLRQGNIRYMHDKHRAVGYVRQYERTERGYLAYDIIPPSQKQVQEEIMDGILTGTSMGFSITRVRRALDADGKRLMTEIGGKAVQVVDIESIVLVERSVVDAPATPGCSFEELIERARYDFGMSRLWNVPAYINAGSSDIDSAPPPAVESGVEAGARSKMDTDTGGDVLEGEADSSASIEPGGNADSIVEENGFLWFIARELSNFEPDTIRYGKEDLSGIVLCGGRLRDGIARDEWTSYAVHKIGFNARHGDGWTVSEIDVYLANRKYFYWDGDEVIALVEMPDARSRNKIMKLFGLKSLVKPDKVVSGDSSSGTVKVDAADSGVEEKKMEKEKEERNGAYNSNDVRSIVGEVVKEIVEPLAEQVKVLVAAETARQKSIDDAAAADAREKAEMELRATIEAEIRAKIAEESKKDAGADGAIKQGMRLVPRGGVGGSPSSPNTPGNGSEKDVWPVGFGVFRDRNNKAFNISDLVS